MFAKLKQKIAEEESTSDSSRSLPSSPSVRRAKVNGWTENKWERRRLSNASSLYESRESLLSESSTVSSGLNVSRHASFTSRSAATPVGTPIEPPGFSVCSSVSLTIRALFLVVLLPFLSWLFNIMHCFAVTLTTPCPRAEKVVGYHLFWQEMVTL